MVLDLSKLGSPSALSLFASKEAMPSLIASGAVLAVTAAIFTYSEFKSYQEKQHKKKVESVNTLYTEFLKQINVPQYGQIHGFPPIFELVDDKYQSMHFTLEQIRDIGSNLPHGSDIALSSYRESVRAAIRKLKEFYFSRKSGSTVKSMGVTAGVLSYLMQMLDTKCLNFLGYDYDIAYLDAICKFINAYSSRGQGEKSSHFSRLAPVYAHLLSAKHKLEKHKEVLSLQETIAELKDSCVNRSDILIRLLVKMVVQDADTELADTVAHEELKEGILRQHYIHTEIFGFEISSDHKIEIPESIFQKWIKSLSDYYLRSLSTELGHEDDNEIFSPEEFFKFLNRAAARFEIKPKVHAFMAENENIDKQLTLIRKVFHDSGNFISTRYNKENKKFEVIKDHRILIDRSLIMAHVAKVTHEVISLQYLCSLLLKSIQLLGDIYVNNPAHFCKIFNVLDRLCALIQEDVLIAQKAFKQLQESNENNMQIEERELFPIQVNEALAAVFGEIKYLGEQVKSCRQLAINAIKPHTIKSVNYAMLEIATNIFKMYFGDSKTADDEIKEDAELQSSEIDKPDIFTPNPDKTSNPLTILEDLTQKLRYRILAIQKTDLFHARHYFKIYDALLVMKNKSIALLNEKTKNPDRLNKAASTTELTIYLMNDTLTYLNKSTTERQSGSPLFLRKIHEQLNKKNNSAFIDRHHNKASRFIYTHVCSQGIFRTDTRKKLTEFENVCVKASIN